MTSVTELAMKARDSAALVVDRHVNPSQKAASLALYRVMADCKALCERCETNREDMAELKRLFAQQPKSGNRRYVEKGSDIYVYVCRFVFTETDRTNAMRYSAALREASKLDIPSGELFEWMKKNGGVNALYFRRPLDARSVKTKCLRLAEQIEISRDQAFTLTLKWRDDNSFEVIAA